MTYIQLFFDALKKININLLACIIFISSLGLLYIPNRYLEILFIQSIKHNHSEELGLATFVSGIYIISIIILKLKTKYDDHKFSTKAAIERYLKKFCTRDFMSFLIYTYYDHEKKAFESTPINEIFYNDNHIRLLNDFQLIYRTTNNCDFLSEPYNLHPCAVVTLNNYLKKKKLIIDSNQFKFKYLV